MANAKRCDICGEFYTAPEFVVGLFPDSYRQQLDYVTIHKADEREASMYFDSCKKCQQDLIDYILTKRADATCPG
jgi:hypothetical protein